MHAGHAGMELRILQVNLICETICRCVRRAVQIRSEIYLWPLPRRKIRHMSPCLYIVS